MKDNHNHMVLDCNHLAMNHNHLAMNHNDLAMDHNHLALADPLGKSCCRLETVKQQLKHEFLKSPVLVGWKKIHCIVNTTTIALFARLLVERSNL